MEKLQIALEKARQKRSGLGGTGVGQPRSPKTAKSSASSRRKSRIAPGVDPVWTGLRRFTPDPKKLVANRIVTLDANPAATVFDVLRTKVVLQMQKNNWSRLAITSPTPGCGKTTMACNMITGLGRQNDMRSILFDLDLRRPATAKLFDTKPDHDITELLQGRIDFDEQALRLGDNVAISMARHSSKDPTRILLSEQASEKLDEIEEIYKPDIMIFDMPPLLMGDDTRAFLQNVDCALLIAWAETTTAAQIDICEKEIAEQTNMMGVVLNRCRHMDSDHGYYDDAY